MTVELPRRALLAIALVTALLTAACGEGIVGGSGVTSPSGPVPSTTPTTSSSPLTVPESPRGGASTPIAVAGRMLIDGTLEVEFTVTTEGSSWFREPRDSSALAYDAAAFAVWGTIGEGGAWFRAGVPPGGPDASPVGPMYDPTWNTIWETAVGRWRADPTAGYELAWIYERSVGEGAEGEQIDVETVSCEVRVVLHPVTLLLSEGRLDCPPLAPRTFELLDLEVDSPVDPGVFRVPEGAEERPGNEGFEPITLVQAGARAGYPVPVPAAPAGFELVNVAFADQPSRYSSVTAAGMPSSDVVVLVWRDGFQRVVVTTRRLSAKVELGKDASAPVAVRYPWPAFREPPAVTVAGAVDGAEVLFKVAGTGRTAPRAWGAVGDVLITVEGTLTDAEAAELLGSFSTSG